ncbi:MAG: sigma-70 family RNA polymerase sigma factor [Planctomycetes bacterium]|nr:sigma-70 family RNA polymerase sigma factor [Planctomycetota bacterium]
MSKLSDKTVIGGPWRTFETTRWSHISLVRNSNSDHQKSIINKLIRTYWKPVYCYLRQKGYDNEQAKDLTQGFFHEIVLGRDLIHRADRSRGRFRTFLLTSLNHYVSNEHRRDSAVKRRPLRQVKNTDADELPDFLAEQLGITPEQSFNYTWATAILDEVLTEVKNSFCETGRTTYWEVFQERVLVPIFEDTKPSSMVEICTKYGIDSGSKASNMIVTVKRRFRAILELKLCKFVREDSTVESEFCELIEALSAGG